MERFRFLLFRPLQLIPVLFGISLVSFVLVQSIPGDPVKILLGPRATPEVVAATKAKFGLDQPIHVQYARFLVNLTEGEFGRSLLYKVPVFEVVTARLPATVFLVVYGVVFAVAVAFPLAIVAAWWRGGWPDHAIRVFSTFGLGLPVFWLGIMLMILLSVELDLFPVSGYGETFIERLHHLFLPALSIALALSPILIRNLRAGLIAEQSADYVTAARARGLGRRAILLRHILPNAILPTVQLLGVNVGWLIGGTVVIEFVFAVPGLGQLMVSSIFARDYMVVQLVTLVFAVAIVATNLLVDVATVALDPRIDL